MHIQKDVLHIQKDVLHNQKEMLPFALSSFQERRSFRHTRSDHAHGYFEAIDAQTRR